MDPSYRILFAALLGIGSVGFFSVLWFQPPYYRFISRRLALAARMLSCLIGCGYLVAAYLMIHDAGSLGAVGVIAICAFLNLFVLAVERPWSRRGQPTLTQRD